MSILSLLSQEIIAGSYSFSDGLLTDSLLIFMLREKKKLEPVSSVL